MIEHLRHGDIDKAWWDAALLRCKDPLWYARSAVLDIASPGWEALVDRSSGAIMPLTWRRKFGVDYLYQPYGLQQLGVFAPVPDAALVQRFFEAVPSRFRYWDIRVNAGSTLPALTDLRSTENTDQVLSLDGDAVQLRAAYSENHRRNVRKAAAAAPYVTDAVDAVEFRALFQQTTGARFGSDAPRDMKCMEALIGAALEEGTARIAGVRKDEVLCAAVCFITWQGRTILFKSAADPLGQELKAMFHLVDRFIGEQAGSGLLLDLAGSNTASVARFNAGFGARTTVYLGLVRNRLPVPLKWLKQ